MGSVHPSVTHRLFLEGLLTVVYFQIAYQVKMVRLTKRVAILKGLEALPVDLQQRIFSLLGLPTKKDLEGRLREQSPWEPLQSTPIDVFFVNFIHDGHNAIWFSNLGTIQTMNVSIRAHLFEVTCQPKKNRYGAFLKVRKIHEGASQCVTFIPPFHFLPVGEESEIITITCLHCECLLHCAKENLDPSMDLCPDCLQIQTAAMKDFTTAKIENH